MLRFVLIWLPHGTPPSNIRLFASTRDLLIANLLSLKTKYFSVSHYIRRLFLIKICGTRKKKEKSVPCNQGSIEFEKLESKLLLRKSKSLTYKYMYIENIVKTIHIRFMTRIFPSRIGRKDTSNGDGTDSLDIDDDGSDNR